ncbi:hypothetical protein N0V82_009619 [Gnomoniopsis sp. IMI 355080]|nr:hypothetical protein N0V82_009619 [Gnomoniopsis sp. IMI 355080]
MMFRCSLRPGGSLHISTSWLPSLVSSGSRGVKLSKLGVFKLPTEYTQAALSVSGREWLKHLAKHNIGNHGELQSVQAKTKDVKIKINAATRHVRKATDEIYLTNMGHPFAEAVIRRYIRDSKEKPLWCQTASISQDTPIVKGLFKKRAHAAFYQALRNAGYDTAGRRITQRTAAGRTRFNELFGTVRIVTHEPKQILNIPFTTLREFFEQVVSRLEQKLGKTSSAAVTTESSESSKNKDRKEIRTPDIIPVIRSKEDTMLVSLTVGKVDAGVTVLLTPDKRLIEFPSILLPPDISSGSIVDITVARNTTSESLAEKRFQSLQDQIYNAFGAALPATPSLRCRNATQTSVVLEWDPIQLATADLISLSLFRNGQKAGVIPKPLQMHTTKISGLAVDTKYVFHLVLRTTAGTYTSDKVEVQTHKMTDLSGITITTGILPQAMRENLAVAVERIGAKIVDSVRIDTTHFVTTEGRGIQWEKAVEMNIPVVRPEWVDACEKSGRILGVTKFYLDALRPGPPNEDRPGTATQQQPPQQQSQQAQSPPATAPAPPAKDKDLPAAPSAQNGDESSASQENKVEKLFGEDEAAQRKEEAVEGDDQGESEDEKEDKKEDKAKIPVEDEQSARAEEKEETLAVRPLAATIQDVEEDKASPPASASRASFQDVQL